MNANANVRFPEEYDALDSTVESIVIADHVCNSPSFTTMDLALFVNLRTFEVGDFACTHVEEVKMIGMKCLEMVVIGEKSCSQWNHHWEKNPSHHFYLKDCERLREVKIGCKSFSDYSVCEMENLHSLEVMQIGKKNEDSWNFFHASLELKGEWDGMNVMNRLAQVEDTSSR